INYWLQFDPRAKGIPEPGQKVHAGRHHPQRTYLHHLLILDWSTGLLHCLLIENKCASKVGKAS
ncbi:hypothetical protein, partial [Streptococcus pneumoniae]|uniref:hypothetical protein n=1 Tax=Streptococcus pneumoniae TaxID=1313 RepID=UPI001E63E6AE